MSLAIKEAAGASARRRAPTREDYEEAGRLRLALQDFLRRSELIVRGHGLTSERYQLLLLVKLAAAEGRSATVADLATSLHLARSTVTQLVRRAENLRLVRRELSERDARIRYLVLTEEGERRLGAAVTDLGEERVRLLELVSRLQSERDA